MRYLAGITRFHQGLVRARRRATEIFFGAHMRKQQDIANSVFAEQHHDEPVDANAAAARRWQAVSKRTHVIHIHLVRGFRILIHNLFFKLGQLQLLNP